MNNINHTSLKLRMTMKIMMVAGLFCLSNLQAMDWDSAFAVFKGSTTKMTHEAALDRLEADHVSIAKSSAGEILALYLADDKSHFTSLERDRLTKNQSALEAALAKYNEKVAAAASAAAAAATSAAAASADATRTSAVSNAMAAAHGAPKVEANIYVPLATKAAKSLAGAIKAVPESLRDEVKQAIAKVLQPVANIAVSKSSHNGLGRLSSKKASKHDKN